MSSTVTTAVILYYLGQQPVASPLAQIRFVRRCTGRMTPVPGTPDWLSGVMPVSGELLPLLDLSIFLSLSDQHPGRPAALLVCQLFHRCYGVLVSHCVGRFDASLIVPQETTGITEPLRPYVTEQVQVKDTVCPLFDLIALCAAPEIAESP